MIDPLRSIGIEKGKPFNSNAGTKDLLVAARPRIADVTETFGSVPDREVKRFSAIPSEDFLATYN